MSSFQYPNKTRLSQLPLRPSTQSLLQQRGFSYLQEIEESKSRGGGLSNLAHELQLSLSETAALVREVQTAVGGVVSTTPIERSTAFSILQQQKQQQHPHQKSVNSYHDSILTCSKSLDELLGGGIRIGEVTEVFGVPGAGKTQFAQQLCVATSLPNSLGGVDGQAIYIDTEGSFGPERCLSMATALMQHLRRLQQHKNTTNLAEEIKLRDDDEEDAKDILDRIHVYRSYDLASLLAILEVLPTFVETMGQDKPSHPIRLIVIDSVAFPFRCSHHDYEGRMKSLNYVATNLANMANKYHLAVFVVNQMTTKRNEDSSTEFIPALGETWAHSVTNRLLLEQSNPGESSMRTCRLVKCPYRPCGIVSFDILESGIRDIPSHKAMARGIHDHDDEVSKRQRL